MKVFNLMSTSFENFDNTIRTYLSKTFNSIGMQYTHNQIFGVIFDGIKGVLQNMLFYIEDALTEQNVFTASRKKSIYSLAKVSGYEPYYGSASTGTILAKTFVTNNLALKSTKLQIYNYSRVYNKNTGITYTIFLNTNKYVIDVSDTLINHEFKIVQGEWKSYQYACRGEAFEKVSIDASGLFDRDYIEVTINGEKWMQVSSLYDMTTDGKEYILSVGYENIFDVMFGNGIYGKIPENGDVVVIKYLSHSGSVGNIKSTDSSKFEFYDTGYDSFGNSVNLNDYIKLSMKNVISGGTDADSIEFVKNMIGCNSRSNVLANEDNFKLFFKRFSFIGYVNCWSENNSMTVIATCLSNVLDNLSSIDEYFTLTYKDNKNKLLLDAEQKKMVINTLENSNKSFAGLTLKFQDPVIRRYSIFCYLKSDSSYYKGTIEDDIKKAVVYYFLSLPENTQFIPKSDLVAVMINSNEEIKSLDIDIVSELAEQTYANGYYYTYISEFTNNTYQYIKKKVYYEKDTYPGLDIFGNISLNTKFEIPVISNDIRYYVDKENNSKDSIPLSAIEFIWI